MGTQRQSCPACTSLPPGHLQALLLLLLLGAQGQGSAPSPGCGCARDSQKRNGLLCCRGCPAGQYLAARCTKPCGNATCLPCPQGTFLARENHHEISCARCGTCDDQLSQVALRNCSAVADTSCGCRPGWVMECLDTRCVGSLLFQCRSCVDCGALHRHTQVPCSSTKCGACLPGFYEYGNSCVSCPTSAPWSCPGPCAAVCGWRQSRCVLGPGAPGRPGGPTPARCHPDLHIPPLPARQVDGSRRWSWDGGPDPTTGKTLRNVLEDGEQAPRPLPSGAETEPTPFWRHPAVARRHAPSSWKAMAGPLVSTPRKHPAQSCRGPGTSCPTELLAPRHHHHRRAPQRRLQVRRLPCSSWARSSMT
ncbi:tumor necrosis factor receptor superfamily member 25 isoform X7 [Artibeus jamaicensis]|uniref:tumor necrosis factor receptor superfamily member 25 isoform X7 n=1 Tax=Artibeus jamaicensis TaxID=9417 RepID=UPI00235AB434|nr:tumor necrosis factor receptor superfamily member 25 isoform X7 [Artibeus jamaicensis]